MAESGTRFGYFSLFMLQLNEELLAAHFSFTHRDRCYSPIVTYNEKFSRFAPGHLIVEEILRYCVARGIRGFDITGQDQEWKMKWTTEARPFSHYYVFRGPLGNLAFDLGLRLKPAVHRLLASRARSGGEKPLKRGNE
jgi:CelD/BcsL family acetyltransferase involved in cellulose biosynthesis